MRTSRLRRWMLRGALISAAAMAPLTAAAPAQADWVWQDLPPQVATPAAEREEADSDLAREATDHRSNGVGDDDYIVESATADWTWQ